MDGNGWDIIEVKSSTSVKNVYIFDLAFQAFVYAGAGLKIRRFYLMLTDPDFIRHGKIDPARFFQRHDVTDRVSAASRQIEPRLEEMFKTIRLQDCPDIRIGPQSNDPYTFPPHDKCWNHLNEGNVTQLYRGGAKRFQLLVRGTTAIADIPDEFKLTDNQEIQRQAAKTGRPRVNKSAIRPFLDGIKYPAAYLDYDSWSTAIPLLDGVRPYQQTVFQYSLHVVRSPKAEPEHHEFLAEGTGEPRCNRGLLKRPWWTRVGDRESRRPRMAM